MHLVAVILGRTLPQHGDQNQGWFHAAITQGAREARSGAGRQAQIHAGGRAQRSHCETWRREPRRRGRRAAARKGKAQEC